MKSKKLSPVDDQLEDLIGSNDEYEDDPGDISDDDVGRLKTIDRKHENLLHRVKETVSDKKNRKKIEKVRSEPFIGKKGPSTLAPLSSMITLDDLITTTTKSKTKGKTSQKTLSLRELASTILKTTADTSRPVVKELTKLARKKSLPAPLRKPQADQASRVASYEDVKSRTIKKWADIVTRHKTADHLSFPLPVIRSLDDESAVNATSDIVSSNKKPASAVKKNEFEAKIESLLSSSENRLEDNKELTVAEEKLLQSLSVEEARDRIRELQRTRALLSYQEAKKKREAKIKSKSFHRVRKREKLRDALKNFESLKQSDPHAALQQLQEFDKSRALERASLRHRNTGKFAKQAKIRAKYDDEARNALEEQMHIHQQSMKRREFSSDEEDEAVKDGQDGEGDDKEDQEINDDPESKQDQDIDTEDREMDDPFDVADNYNPWLRPSKSPATNGQESEKSNEAVKEVKQVKLRKSFLLNPNDDIVNADGDADNEQDGDRLSLRQRSNMDMISEAFADDGVIEEFVKEREEENAGKDDDDGKNLPGWGSWTGVDSELMNKQDSKKRRRQRQQEYRDSLNKKLKKINAKDYDPKVIINQEAIQSSKGGDHRVKQIPFPFKSVPEFEAGILSNPIGRSFVPETAFRVLTRERVTTKMGTIIPPMAEDNVSRRRARDRAKDNSGNKRKTEQQ